MIKISEVAQSHFTQLLSTQPEETGIRVFVNSPATYYAECGVSYCPKENVSTEDIELKFETFLVYIDKHSAPYLEEAEIDFIVDEMGSQLTLKAPNAKIKKPSEDASLIEQVDYYIQTKINPQLAAHNGHISLIELTDDGDVIIQFGGGCNGCSMVDHTLKEGVEKELLEHFPLIKGVKDITEHQHGQHSFY